MRSGVRSGVRRLSDRIGGEAALQQRYIIMPDIAFWPTFERVNASLTNWTVPFSGRWVVGLQGAGGGAWSTNGNAPGGGAGGLAVKWITLSQGQVIAITWGARGATMWVDTPPPGNGGASTLTLPGGTVLTANGGNAATSSSVAGTGGTATGGDFNYTGGNGGTAGQDGTAGSSPEPYPLIYARVNFGTPSNVGIGGRAAGVPELLKWLPASINTNDPPPGSGGSGRSAASGSSFTPGTAAFMATWLGE